MTRHYWDQRSELEYYKVVRSISEEVAGETILDVGGWNTPLALSGDFQRRLVVNLLEVPENERWDGLEYHFGDFMQWDEEPFDLVLCLQTIEHLEDARPFVQKLFSVGKTVIISVPFNWPKGSCKYHKQDPINLDKLHTWTDRNPNKTFMTQGSRIVCLYES